VTNTFHEIAFWVLATTSVGGALFVVRLNNVFRSALMLAVCFLGMAGLFVLLNAEFLAVVQLLIYVGAISVLLIFAVMLTRDIAHSSLGSSIQPVAAPMLLFLAGILIWRISIIDWIVFPKSIPSTFEGILLETPQILAGLLIGDFVLAFEIAGFVLLSAVVAALALVREG
jgi:NADH-quinone oxidoreductase subunit J